MGHTFPGATVPFGSVQLSPDTHQQPHNSEAFITKKHIGITPAVNTMTEHCQIFALRILAGQAIRILAIF